MTVSIAPAATAGLLPVSTTQAAILVEQRQPLVVDEILLPRTLDYGQVLVKLAYSGICGSQLGEIDGIKGADRFLPHLLGHEGSGTILTVGPGVTTVTPGDSVVLHWRPGSGIAAPAPRYHWRGKELNAGWVTTFNEHAIVSENRVTTIPHSCDMAEAALLGCAVTTGFGVINNDARVRIGESVVVWGAGGVGLSIVQGAALAGAYPIIAIDLHQNRLSLAASLGATHCLDGRSDNINNLIRDRVGASGADVVVDNTGNVGVIERAYAVTKAKGRTILVGVPSKGDNPSLSTLPLHFGKKITGSHGGGSVPHEDIPRYLSLSESGRLDFSALITMKHPLSAVNEAITSIRNGTVSGRCLLSFD